ncbi:MAG: NHLP bacteriocin system secretion protein [Acidobacteriota bacterium]
MIFRKVALERLSSPEQLDQLLQVTTPRGWLALAALGALIVSALVWGVFGSLPTEAPGSGILLRRGGVSDVVSNVSGQVEEVRVRVGDTLEQGQVVATVRQEALERRIDETVAKLQARQQELDDMMGFTAEQERLQTRNRAQERRKLERTLETLDTDIALLQERIAAQEDLLTDGLITKQDLVASQQDLNNLQDRVASTRLELASLDLTRLEKEQVSEQQIEQQRTEVRDLEFEIADLRAQLQEDSQVLSPVAGRVLELIVDPGDVISPGKALLSMEMLGEKVIAILFVPASDGKKIKPGMEAQVSPSTVKREEFGYMLGQVSWVAEFPSTRRGMIRLLANDDLVTGMMADGPPIQVEVELERDASTPTGFRWSSSRGPELEITSGTLAAGSVVIERNQPIHLVIPTVKEKLGV